MFFLEGFPGSVLWGKKIRHFTFSFNAASDGRNRCIWKTFKKVDTFKCFSHKLMQPKYLHMAFSLIRAGLYKWETETQLRQSLTSSWLLYCRSSVVKADPKPVSSQYSLKILSQKILLCIFLTNIETSKFIIATKKIFYFKVLNLFLSNFVLVPKPWKRNWAKMASNLSSFFL